MTRSNILGISLLTLLAWLPGGAEAAVITQGAFDTFVAFEAENYESITTTGSTSWIVVSTASPITSPVGVTIIPANSNVSGGAALLANYGINNHESTVTYRIAFETEGTYRFYVRYSMYEHSKLDGSYGNEDSFYRAPDFDEACTSGDTNIVTGFSTPNVEGVYGWLSTGVGYTVTADDVAASYVQFMIDNRERGLSIDRIIFSTVNLSTSVLDLLWNSGDAVTNFTDADSGDSSWATTGNWSNGEPTVDKWVYVGDAKTANLDTGAAVAYGLTIGHAAATTTGGGTLTQSAGNLAIGSDMQVGVIAGSTAAYNMSGGTIEVGGDVVLGASGSNGIVNLTGGQMSVAGSLTGGTGTSTVNVDGGTLTVGGDLNVKSLRVGYNGRTAQVAVGGDTTVNMTGPLYVGYRDSATINPSATTNGTLDLSGPDSVNLTASAIAVGALYADINQTLNGMLKLATTGNSSISAATITIGESTAGYTPSVKGSLVLGADNTIRTNNLYLGRRKATGEMTIGAGGVLDLAGLTGGKANLYIGYCDTTTTGTVNLGTMNLLGGTFNALLGELVIGYHLYPWNDTVSGSGTGVLSFNNGTVTADSINLGVGSSNTDPTYGFREGRGVGTLNMGGGSFQAGSVTLATGSTRTEGTINLTGGTLTVTGSLTGGTGTSTVNVDGGTLTVGGNVVIDVLRVGDRSRTGIFTVTGANSTVQVGSVAEPTNMVIGHKSANNTTATGTVDLSAAASFTAYLDSLLLGQTESDATQNGGVGRGTLRGAATNTIHANTIQLGDTRNGDWDSSGTINLGTINTIHVDEFYVGRAKSLGIVTVASGGILTLDGNNGATADLFIGYNDQATGAVSDGQFNMSGATFNATLDQLVIGHKSGGGTGGAQGSLTMNAGTLTASSVILADRLDSSTGTVTGTISLSGGEFSAGSITKGTGTANFNFTGGTLHVDTFGSETRPFDLVQNGGTLAPGNSPGMTTIHGDYTMNTVNPLEPSALEIEINGLDQGDQGLLGNADDGIGYDYVMVHGDATLAGSLNVLLLDDFYPVLGTHFDVLETTGLLDITGLALDDELAQLPFGWWEMAAIPSLGGEGSILRLSAVPEPSTALLAALVLLAGCVRRRRR